MEPNEVKIKMEQESSARPRQFAMVGEPFICVVSRHNTVGGSVHTVKMQDLNQSADSRANLSEDKLRKGSELSVNVKSRASSSGSSVGDREKSTGAKSDTVDMSKPQVDPPTSKSKWRWKIPKFRDGSSVDSPLTWKDRLKAPVTQPLTGLSEKGKKVKEAWKMPKPTLMNMMFFGVNLVLFLFGFGLVMLAILTFTDSNTLNKLLQFDTTGRLQNVNLYKALKDFNTGTLLFGMFGVSLGLLGCCGFLMGNRRMLKLYSIAFGLVVAAEIFAILSVLVAKGPIEDSVKKSLKESMEENYEGREDSSRLFSQVMDVAQLYFGCCGLLNYSDFEKTPWYRDVNSHLLKDKGNATNTTDTTTGPSINVTIPATTTESTTVKPGEEDLCPNKTKLFPLSCCQSFSMFTDIVQGVASVRLQNPDCMCLPPGRNNPNTLTPCYDAVETFLLNKVFVILGLVVTILGLEISAVSNAYSISKHLKEEFLKRNDPKRLKKKKKKEEEEEEEKDKEKKETDKKGDEEDEKKKKEDEEEGKDKKKEKEKKEGDDEEEGEEEEDEEGREDSDEEEEAGGKSRSRERRGSEEGDRDAEKEMEGSVDKEHDQEESDDSEPRSSTSKLDRKDSVV